MDEEDNLLAQLDSATVIQENGCLNFMSYSSLQNRSQNGEFLIRLVKNLWIMASPHHRLPYLIQAFTWR